MSKWVWFVSAAFVSASNSWKRLELPLASQIKVCGTLGWISVIRRIEAAGAGCRNLARPNANKTATTSMGRMISACHAKRAAGLEKMARPAEYSDSETHTTRNETP